jgi:hypothetical protein
MVPAAGSDLLVEGVIAGASQTNSVLRERRSLSQLRNKTPRRLYQFRNILMRKAALATRSVAMAARVTNLEFT